MTMTSITLEDGKEYLIISTVECNDNRYFVMISEDDDNDDMCIRKIKINKDNEEVLVKLDSKKEFYDVLNVFNSINRKENHE